MTMQGNLPTDAQEEVEAAIAGMLDHAERMARTLADHWNNSNASPVEFGLYRRAEALLEATSDFADRFYTVTAP